MIISVTRKHIQRGKRRTALSCPVALAVKESVGDPRVGVTYQHIRVHNTYYKVPCSVELFLRKVDDGVAKKDLKPFNFKLVLKTD